MKTLKQIIQKVETFAPPSLAPFDYVGLLQGDSDQEITKIGLTLDYSLQAIHMAIESKCELLITHHGPTRIHYPLYGNLLDKVSVAAHANLSIYRSHLSLDFCKGGIIEELCKILNIPALPVTTKYEDFEIAGGVALAEHYPMTFPELHKRIKKLHVASFRIAGKKKTKFSKIAVTSGKGFISEFFDQLKPEVYIAGEFEQEAVKYAEDRGMMLVELSHHASEARALEGIARTLSKFLKVEVISIEVPDTITNIPV